MPYVPCDTCGKSFYKKPRMIKKTNHNYCCRECAAAASRKYPIQKSCEFCDQQFEIDHGSTNARYCSRKCSSLAQRTRIELACNVCGKTFSVNPHRYQNGNPQFCSMKCRNTAWASEGKPQPRDESKYIESQCEICGQSFTATEWNRKKGKDRFCSHICYAESLRRKRGEAHPLYKKIAKSCLQCGKLLKVAPSVINRTKFCSRHCAGAWNVIHNNKQSSLERIVADLLAEIGVIFESQKGIGPYACDFFIPSANLVIEADGEYWHSLPANKVRDRRKTTFLLNNGYQLLRLPERTVRSNSAWCKKQILNALKPGAWQSPLF